MIKMNDARRLRGFTLAELLMASLVISVALLGVYGLFKQTMEVEAKLTLDMYHQSRAEQVADFLADQMDRCINLKDVETLRAQSGEQGSFVEFTAVGKGFTGEGFDTKGVVRQRLTWQLNEAKSGYVVKRQIMKYAGKTNLTFQDESQADWSALPATELFHQVDALEIEFQDMEKSRGHWQKEYAGAVGTVAVRVKAASGERICQRIVLPAARMVLE